MTDATLLQAFMDSLKEPFLFADTKHIISYMNRAAVAHYEQGLGLIGTSLLACHNAESNRVIEAVFEKMQAGLVESLITDNKKHRIYMRAVRDEDGELLGYYERFEPPRSK